MKTKGNDYLKNGIKTIKTLYQMKVVNDDLKKPHLAGKRKQTADLKKAAVMLKKDIGQLRQKHKKTENASNVKNGDLFKTFSLLCCFPTVKK